MCYKIKTPKQKEMEERFQRKLKDDLEYQSRQMNDGFLFAQLPVITAEAPEVIDLFNWGLVPQWCKDEKTANEIRPRTLNAKSETVHELPSYRDSHNKGKRCLILVQAFYEYRHETKTDKYPYLISMKDNRPFAMAGIYQRWKDRTTVALLTTSVNSMMAYIHNSAQRMPAILLPSEENLWISNDINSADAMKLIKPYPDELMKAHTISKAIGTRSQDKEVPELYELHDYGLKIFE